MTTNTQTLQDPWLDTLNNEPKKEPAPQPDSDNREWLKKLPGLLRGFGTLAVLFSLYSFFARGWEGSSDLVRYLMLLGHTGILAAIGLTSGHFLKEGKGARLLLTLALVSVVANFAILGAFIFAGAYAGKLGFYPYYLAWNAGSLSTALVTAAGSLLVLLPVVRVGFLTLARGVSKRMTLLFLAANAALLIPVREPVMVTILTLLMAGMLLLWCGKSLRQSVEVKTHEGMVALGLMFLPIATLIGRNLWLYTPDALLITTATFAGFIALRQLSLFLPDNAALRQLSENISLVLAVATGLAAADMFTGTAILSSGGLIGGTLISAAMTYELASRSCRQGAAYRALASAMAVAGLALNQLLFGGILASLISMVAGLALISTSYVAQQRSMLVGGALLFIGGIAEPFIRAFQMFNLGYWAMLAMTGIVAILIASLMESKGEQLKERLSRWKARYSEWSY